jgi:hypothetical protein
VRKSLRSRKSGFDSKNRVDSRSETRRYCFEPLSHETVKVSNVFREQSGKSWHSKVAMDLPRSSSLVEMLELLIREAAKLPVTIDLYSKLKLVRAFLSAIFFNRNSYFPVPKVHK